MFSDSNHSLQEIKEYLTQMTDIKWNIDSAPRRCILKSDPISNPEHKDKIAELLFSSLHFSNDSEVIYDYCYLQEHNGISVTWSFVLSDTISSKMKSRIESVYEQMSEKRQSDITRAEEYKRQLNELTGMKWSVSVAENQLLRSVFLWIDEKPFKPLYDLLLSTFNQWSCHKNKLKWEIKRAKFYNGNRYVVTIESCDHILPLYYTEMKTRVNGKKIRAERIARKLSDCVQGIHFAVAEIHSLLQPISLLVFNETNRDLILLLREGGWVDDLHAEVRSVEHGYTELPLASINVTYLFSDELSISTEFMERLDEQRRIIFELKEEIKQYSLGQQNTASRFNEVAIELNVVQEKIIELQLSAASCVREDDILALEDELALLKENITLGTSIQALS